MLNFNYPKTYLYLLYFTAFAIPLSHAGISMGVVLLFIVWLLERNYQATWELVKSTPLLIALGLFLVYGTLSLLWTSNIPQGLDYLRVYGYWLLIPIIAASIEKASIERVITAFLLGMMVSEIAAYGMYFELWRINGRGAEDPSPFMIHIDYSILLATTSLLLLNRLLSTHYTLKEKLLMALFFITVTGNLFIATGRTGQVAFLAAVIVAGVVHFHASIKKMLLVALLGFGIIGVAYVASDNFKLRVMQVFDDVKRMQEGDYYTSVGTRSAFWILAWDMTQDAPLTGFGIGDMRLSAKHYLETRDYGFGPELVEFCNTNHFHNQYLVILVQLGLLGIILLGWILYAFYRLPCENPEIKKLSVVFLTIFAVGFLGEPLWSKQFTMMLFVLFTALFVRSSIQKSI